MQPVFVKQRYFKCTQEKCRRCVLVLVRQCLSLVFCLSASFSPFSFTGKPKCRALNLTKVVTGISFATCDNFHRSTRSERTSVCSALLRLERTLLLATFFETVIRPRPHGDTDVPRTSIAACIIFTQRFKRFAVRRGGSNVTAAIVRSVNPLSPFLEIR